MREIKFRAWVLGKMYEVKNLEWDWGHLIITTEGGWIALPDPNAHLLEFTGLHDKNGVEIYEGDVLRYEGFEGSIDHAEVCWHQGFLAWMVDDHSGRGMISLCDLNDDDTNQFNSDEVEVIGNIHENPELLESPDA
jgi:uncharacterized phage protein (TIGR01671 family)